MEYVADEMLAPVDTHASQDDYESDGRDIPRNATLLTAALNSDARGFLRCKFEVPTGIGIVDQIDDLMSLQAAIEARIDRLGEELVACLKSDAEQRPLAIS